LAASPHSLLLLEKSQVMGARLARVLSSATDLSEVHVGENEASLAEHLSERTVAVALDAAELDLALKWVRGDWSKLAIICWSQSSLVTPLRVAVHAPQLQSIIGWPPHQSIPRHWELTVAARRALDPFGRGPRLNELLAWGATSVKWSPRTSSERDDAVAGLERYAALAGASSRVIERLAVVAHEMLMNAMYDAPVDAHGRAHYAHDRKADLILDERETPTLRFVIDGAMAGLEVTDAFGGLRREHVLGSILRGTDAQASAQAPVVDTSHGGAGLGFFRMYTTCSSVLVDVKPGEQTRVTALFDLDSSGREARNLPASLHLFSGATS
jgi:hypothetical protein